MLLRLGSGLLCKVGLSTSLNGFRRGHPCSVDEFLVHVYSVLAFDEAWCEAL